MDTITKILFRLVVAYSAIFLAACLVFLPDKPWGRGFGQSDSRPREKPVHCDEVEPADARRRVDEVLRRMATEEDPAHFRRAVCLAYYDLVAMDYERAMSNWRSRTYWAEVGAFVAMFLLPGWLLWAIVRWAILAPLRARRGE